MIKSKVEGERLTVFLKNEIDHCAADKLRQEIEALIVKYKIKQLRFDFSDVTFMDSSGIGMLIGRYKTMKSLQGTTSVCCMRKEIERLFRLAGLHRIIAIEEERGQKHP